MSVEEVLVPVVTEPEDVVVAVWVEEIDEVEAV